jgi:hypothetical protein
MKLIASAAALLFAVACGGGGTVTPTTAPGRTTAPGQTSANPATTVPQASTPVVATPAPPAPQPGSGTVAVTLTGGEHAGTYTGSENPNCSESFFATDAWGVQYSVFDGVEAGDLSSVQVVYRPNGASDSGDEMFPGVVAKFTIGIGPLFDTGAGYKEYDVEVHEDTTESSGTGTVSVQDNGSTAVIHATGTTEDGVGIDATVNCPLVSRP